MTIKQFFIFAALLATVFAFTVAPVLAQGGGGTTDTGVGGSTTSGSGRIQNPLGDVEDPRELIGNIIRAILGIVGSIALAVFIFGGVTWVTSAGNKDRITKGKNMLIWASLGLAVIFASYAMVTFVIQAVTGSTGAGS